MANIILKRCGFSTAIEKQTENTLDVTIRALSNGNYTDMNGTEVEVTPEIISNIAATYNEHVKNECLRESEFKEGLKPEEYLEGLNQVNHDEGDAYKTVGRVIGFMDVREIGEKTYLFMRVRVLGNENVERVADGRWRDVSIQYNPTSYEFVEISWVTKGADSVARAMLSKKNGVNEMLPNLQNTVAIIAKKQDAILRMDAAITKLRKHLDAKKYLVALCKSGKLNRARANIVESELVKFENPVEAMRLLDSCLLKDKFKPKIIKDNDLIIKLLKGNNMANEKQKFASIDDAFSSIKLATDKSEEKEIEKSDIDEDHDLARFGEVRRGIMKKMGEAYDKGDFEMGKKHRERLMKFEDDCAMGKVNLAEYDIDLAASESEEVKELSKKIDHLNTELTALRNEITVNLAKAAESTVKMSSAEIEDLEKKEDINIQKIERGIAEILAELHGRSK